MPKPTELTRPPQKILIYGPAGTGKTALVMTLGSDLELIDLDRGWATGLNLQDKFTEQRKNVEITECIDTNPQVPMAFSQAKKRLFEISNELVKKTYKQKVLCIDSLTSLGEGAVREVLKNSGHSGKAPTLPEWGLAIIELENLLAMIKSFQIPVILNAHQSKVMSETGTGNDKVVKVDIEIGVIGRKLPETIPTYFDEVWYTKVTNAAGNKKNFMIQTNRSENTLARSRANVPDLTDMNLGMVEIMKKAGVDLVK